MREFSIPKFLGTHKCYKITLFTVFGVGGGPPWTEKSTAFFQVQCANFKPTRGDTRTNVH